MAVSMTAMPHLLAIQLLYLPNLDAFLTKLDLADTGLQEVLFSWKDAALQILMTVCLFFVVNLKLYIPLGGFPRFSMVSKVSQGSLRCSQATQGLPVHVVLIKFCSNYSVYTCTVIKPVCISGSDAGVVSWAGDVPRVAAAHRGVLHSARLLQVQTGARRQWRQEWDTQV